MPLKNILTQKQKLSLTVHMKQSLEILQMDSVALKERIERELQSNPVLEEILGDETAPIAGSFVDMQYSDDAKPDSSCHNSDNADDPFSYLSVSSLSLYDHLQEQLDTMAILPELLPLVRWIIMNLDDNGWLMESPEEISGKYHIPIGKVYDALAVIQELDPAGVGAADYKDCLLIQARRQAFCPAVMKILESDKCLMYLSRNEIPKIAKEVGITTKEASSAVRQILSLNPKPGAAFGASTPIYVVPDAYVYMEGSKLSITVGNPIIPDIQISNEYIRILDDSTDLEVKEYLNACLKQAQSLISGIAQRNRTFFLCVSEVVRLQPDYFRDGRASLIPMTMGDVANAIQVNVSTISRTVKNKYIACCHGVVPFHTLFTSKLQSENSDMGVSSQKIRRLIHRYINEENKERPLSDPDIARMLSCEGYSVARRTVAKYRSQMNIPSADKRKIHS